jgi:hypothetical protein
VDADDETNTVAGYTDMTSLRQIESNRRNAQKSTGPKTDAGRQRASQNALSHGLTAETVIKFLEDPDDYRAFELAVTAGYEAETAVERELALRLASLLWRLRRATSIETVLLQNQDNLLQEPRIALQLRSEQNCDIVPIFLPEQAAVPLHSREANNDGSNARDPTHGPEAQYPETTPASRETDRLDVAQRFLGVVNLDNGAFDRLGRYEAALWRQVRQTIFTLEALRWRAPSARHWRMQGRWRRTTGFSDGPPDLRED